MSPARLAVIPCAFEGFRVVARRPASFLAWCAIAGLMLGAELAIDQGLRGAVARLDPHVAFLAEWAAMAPVSLVGLTLIACAACRAVLTPGARAFAGLRLGAAELRVMGVSAIAWGAGFGVIILLGLALAFARLQLAYAYRPIPWAGLPWISGAVLAAGVLLPIPAAVLGVRLSLAAPIALVERRRAFATAWAMSRGRFWRLLGLWTVAAVLALLIELAGQVVLGLTGQPSLASQLGLSVHPFVRPNLGVAAACGVGMLTQTLETVTWSAAGAAAYAALAGPRDAAAEVFD